MSRVLDRLARRPWLVVFVLVSALHICWALAIPRNGGPDEPSHLRTAAADVRGQLLPPHEPGYADGVRLVTVPAALAGRFWPCFAFEKNETAGCQQPVDAGGGDTAQLTTSGKYPPLPYVPAGVGSFVTKGYRLHYAMRVAQALAMAALVAWAVAALARSRGGRLSMAGVLVALTPTAMFLGGVVNPNGIEDVGGLLLFSAGIALVAADADEQVRTGTVVAFAVGGIVLVSSRTLSPLWLLVAMITFVVAGRPGRLRVLVRRRDVRVALYAIGLATVAQAVWIVVSGLLRAVDKQVALTSSQSQIARGVAGRTSLLFRQMIGQFGWYETNASTTTTFVWIAALVLLVGLALVIGRRRASLAMGVVVAAYLFVPVVVDLREAKLAGLVWQGRYSIPLIAGVTVLAGWELDRAGVLPLIVRRRLANLIGVLFVAAQVTGFVWALRRYMVGVDGEVMFWRSQGWRPPFPPLALLGVHAMATALTAWWLVAGVTRVPREIVTDEVPTDPTTSGVSGAPGASAASGALGVDACSRSSADGAETDGRVGVPAGTSASLTVEGAS